MAFVLWVPYDSASADVFDIPTRDMETSKQTVSDAQVEKWVGAVSSAFRSGHLKTLAEAVEVVRSVLNPPLVFQNYPPMLPSLTKRLSRKTGRVT